MIPVRGFEGKTVAVFGLARTGLAAARALIAGGLSSAGVPLVEQVLLSAAMCLVSAWLGWMLHRAEREAAAAAAE